MHLALHCYFSLLLLPNLHLDNKPKLATLTLIIIHNNHQLQKLWFGSPQHGWTLRLSLITGLNCRRETMGENCCTQHLNHFQQQVNNIYQLNITWLAFALWCWWFTCKILKNLFGRAFEIELLDPINFWAALMWFLPLHSWFDTYKYTFQKSCIIFTSKAQIEVKKKKKKTMKLEAKWLVHFESMFC